MAKHACQPSIGTSDMNSTARFRSHIYDAIVIGAGIAGSSAAFALHRAGLRVMLVDRSSVAASGGSGAAGAFVAPKIGKGGPLQQLTNEAFEYAHRFYREHFPEHFTASGVVRIPRDAEDAKKYQEYSQYNISKYENWNEAKLKHHKIDDPLGGFFFPDAGDCDAPALCRALAERVDFRQFRVERLRREEGVAESVWLIEGRVGEETEEAPTQTLRAHRVVLATGHQNDLLDMRYMGVKGLWGSRGDYRTTRTLPVSLHKRLSVSSSRQGIVKIGATHVKHPNPCVVCDGQPLSGLFAEASKLVDTSDFVLERTYCGMRSGSRDFFPVVGPVIDVPWMLEHHSAIVRGAKAPLQHYPDLYILNGLGGRGFVWAPLMAEWLSGCIVEKRPIVEAVHPDRLFWKWVRKQRSI